MCEPDAPREFLDNAGVDEAVFALRRDYRGLLLVAEDIAPGPTDENAEALLREAESAALRSLETQPLEDTPHIAAWREAYRAFGAKPQRTRNSLEALMRRASRGLPRVNRLTDIYNAISLRHQIPLGGEDLAGYDGPPKLIRAIGEEPFDTTTNGERTIEHPDPGEVVWCDNTGVTCRRWNWRQGRRTRLTDATTTVLFIFDALEPISDRDLHAAADDLIEQLAKTSPDLRAVRRLIGPKLPPDQEIPTT